MAILYSYPKVKVDGDELLIITDSDFKKSTRSVSMTSLADWIPTYLQIQDFKLYEKEWCKPLPNPLVDQDIIMYSAVTDTWCPAPNPVPTIPTVVVDVQATYDAVTNEYVGVGTPTITSYEAGVIYRIAYDVTNSTAASTLSIDGLSPIQLDFADSSGVIGPIPQDYITPGLVYYATFINSTFQLSTTPPPASNTALEYSNPLTVSITSPVGGVGTSDNWAAFPDPVTGVVRGFTLEEIMNRIFYPYQIPSFQTFNMAGQSTVLEVGDTLTGGNRSFNFSLSDFNNVEPDTFSVSDETTNTVLDSNLPINSPQTVDIGSDIQYTIQNSHTWRPSVLTTATNPSGQTVVNNKTFTVYWYYRWYWGMSANATLTANEIVALNQEAPSAGTVNTTRNFGTNYWYLCVPDSWNGINNWATGTYPVDTANTGTYNQVDGNFNYALVTGVPVNGTLGTAIDYRVYRSLNLQGTSPGVTISI
tara:strand:- start:7491 stop:8915 length:1425 start_codon:yes stop_codon:yes gene_type:complete